MNEVPFCATQVSCLRVAPREGGGLILVFREFKNLEDFWRQVKWSLSKILTEGYGPWFPFLAFWAFYPTEGRTTLIIFAWVSTWQFHVSGPVPGVLWLWMLGCFLWNVTFTPRPEALYFSSMLRNSRQWRVSTWWRRFVPSMISPGSSLSCE